MRGSFVEIGVVVLVILALFGKTLIPKLSKRIKESKDAAKDAVAEIKGTDEANA